MLEGLDKIDWSKLTHAYGAASDVPDLLRRLASGDGEERKAAIFAFHANIWHQGTVYEATEWSDVVKWNTGLIARSSLCV